MDIEYFANKIDRKYQFCFFDIGAMGGIPLKWSKLSKYIKVVAFEPDEREYKKLKTTDRNIYINKALYEKSIDLQYYISREPGKSSLFMPNKKLLSMYKNSRRFDIVREYTIPAVNVCTLDAVLNDSIFVDIDFIKLDTQGSELSILKGGKEQAMLKIFGAKIEVEFKQLYKGQPLFCDVNNFMAKHGFILVDIKRYYWKFRDYYDYDGKGHLVFGDALYFKDIDIFYRDLSVIKDSEYRRAKIFKSILTCMVYKAFDYAVSIVVSGFDKGYLSRQEREETLKSIKHSSRKSFLFTIPLSRRMYTILYSILRKLRPCSFLGWADADNEILNVDDIY